MSDSAEEAAGAPQIATLLSLQDQKIFLGKKSCLIEVLKHEYDLMKKIIEVGKGNSLLRPEKRPMLVASSQESSD